MAVIEKALANDQNVLVETRARLPDKVTGKLREHDVLLTVKEAHHSFRIAIECRDRSRPVTVGQIEAFAAKCQDTGIDQAILVSSSGFRNSARQKADFHRVRCLDIQQATSFDWLLARGMYSTVRQITGLDWVFDPHESVEIAREALELLDEHGNLITLPKLTHNIERWLKDRLGDNYEDVESATIEVRFHCPEWTLRDSNTGVSTRTTSGRVKVHYTVKTTLIPFRLAQYTDRKGGRTISDAAVADLHAGHVHGQFTIVYREGEGGKVMWTPTPRKGT